jgi:hypothetical protein
VVLVLAARIVYQVLVAVEEVQEEVRAVQEQILLFLIL